MSSSTSTWWSRRAPDDAHGGVSGTNRLGYWSLLAFTVMVVAQPVCRVAVERPALVVRYEGSTYFPVLRDFSEKTFGGDFETPADYLDPFIRQRITTAGNSAVYAPNPYGPKTLNYFAAAQNPAAPSAKTSLTPMTGAATCWRN